MPLDDVLAIGKVINYNFQKDIPELRNFAAEENLNYKIKFIDLMEKHLAALEKLQALENAANPKKPAKSKK